MPSDMLSDVANLRALNQMPGQHTEGSEGLTIAEIRQLPGMREQAESHMTFFKDIIPALASAPSAQPPGLNLQHSVHQPSHQVQVQAQEGATVQHADDELQNAKAQYEDILRQQAQALQELERLKAAQEQQQLNAAALFQQQQAARRQREQLAAQQQAAALQEQRQRIAQAAAALQSTQAAVQKQRQQFQTTPSVHDQSSSVLTHGRRHATPNGEVPTRPAPAYVAQQPVPEYEYFVGQDGMMCRVPKTPPPPVVPVAAPQSFNWVNRWSPTTGRMYQVQVPVAAPAPTPAPPPSMQLIQQQTWRYDPVSGLPCSQATMPPSQQQPAHHRQTVSPHQHLQQSYFPSGGADPAHSSVAADNSRDGQLREKLKGIVSLVEMGDGLKKEKLIDHIKKCPTKWSKDFTVQNMNLPVFAYGVTSELVASLSGRAAPMSDSVLLSKLEHMRNVFEVCCQNSTQTEYNNYGWVLARDYACKVQNKVDQHVINWQSMPSGVQTADLVSAQCEYPRPPPAKAAAAAAKDKDDVQKRTCTTYNSCRTEKKCDYEVQNPGRYCQRKHECSYCRKHLNKSIKHQEWKCPSKDDN